MREDTLEYMSGVLEKYRIDSGSGLSSAEIDMPALLRDLITDVMHVADDADIDFDVLIVRASEVFDEESDQAAT